MSKNAIIGVLVVVVLFVVGYMIVKPDGDTFVTTNTNSTTTTPVVTTPVTGAIKPSAPTVTTGNSVATYNSTAVVTGDVIPNGSQTSYWYEYGITSTLGTRTNTRSIGSGYASIRTPTYITGLMANTQYYYRLSAQNNTSTVQGKTMTFKTNNVTPVSAIDPSVETVSASDVSRTVSTLRANINPNGSNTTFWFEYGLDSNLGNVTEFGSAGTDSKMSPVTHELTGLTPLTKYYFRINAQNQYGTVNGKTLSFTTAGPAAPGIPTVSTSAASKVASTTVTFSGKVNPNGVDTSYWFEYSKDAMFGDILGTITAPDPLTAGITTVQVSLDISGLTNSTKYYYRLVGKNQFGTTPGNVVFFTTK